MTVLSFFQKLRPYRPEKAAVLGPGETLLGFVWRSSGPHQIYVGLLATLVAALNFAPIDLQKRIVDGPIVNKDVRLLVILGAIYLGVVLLQSLLKYALQVYQGWVSESAVKISRDRLVGIAAGSAPEAENSGGQTANVIGNEIDRVGGFVGTSISEFVVNLAFLVIIAGYMLYVEPLIALLSLGFLVPQAILAPYMQAKLNTLFERQVGLVRKLGDEAVAHAANEAAANSVSERTVDAIFSNRIRFYFLKYGLKTLLNLASGMGPLTVLIVGGYMVINGSTTIGVVVAFISGFERLSNPLRDLLNFYREYEQAKVQHQLIVDWVGERGGGESGARADATNSEQREA